MSHDGCLALPGGAIGLSVVCDCGISLSYSLTIFGVLLNFSIGTLKKLSQNQKVAVK